MNEQRRRANLEALKGEIVSMEASSAEVLAAMDATLDELTTSLEHPAHPINEEALAAEIAIVRVELLATRAASDAVRARLETVAAPYLANPTFEAMMRSRHELEALSKEGNRLAERVVMLETTLRELGAEPAA